MKPLTAEQVREALACGIGSMRERESLGILPQRYAEAQSILRRLLESGFVEAAIKCFKQFDENGEAYRYDMTKVLDAYRRLQTGKGE